MANYQAYATAPGRPWRRSLFGMRKASTNITHPPSKPKILLVCSAGGHLLELFVLNEAVWSRFDRVWVTLRQVDSESLLESEKTYYGFGPTNRNYINLVRNVFLAFRVLFRERPTCVISSGAGLAIPFMYLGRLFGARTIYLESFARFNGLSLSGRVVYHVVDDFIVQSHQLAARFQKAVYLGAVF
jgi:beta-1,4-N-acetylglucosaminyltransferase